MHYPLKQSLNIIAGMLGKKVSTMWCMKMEWGVWRVEGSAAAVSRLQTACREKLMNTAALQCGPIRGEHSCHVTGYPPMRGQQRLCKQSGHMQPLASAARCQHSGFCWQISPSSPSPQPGMVPLSSLGVTSNIFIVALCTHWSGWPRPA